MLVLHSPFLCYIRLVYPAINGRYQDRLIYLQFQEWLSNHLVTAGHTHTYCWLGITWYNVFHRPPSLFKYSICARFKDVVLCTFPSSCARFTAVVHVSQKLCTCHRSCARLTSPQKTFVFNCIHSERILIIKSIGATKHVLPCWLYILDYPHSLCCIKITWKIPWKITIFLVFSHHEIPTHTVPPKNFAPGRSWPDPATGTPGDGSQKTGNPSESAHFRWISPRKMWQNVTTCEWFPHISGYMIYIYIIIFHVNDLRIFCFFSRLNMTSHDG